MQPLTLLIFLPLAGMLGIMLLPVSMSKYFRWLALATTVLQAVWFFTALLSGSDTAATEGGFRFYENHEWIRWSLGQSGELRFRYILGLDGINTLLVLLCQIIFPIAVLASWNQEKNTRAYFLLFLLLDISVLGCFSALDLFLFFLFFEFMLLQMFFLIGVWGYERKEFAAVKFFLYTLFGSVFLLLVMIGLAFSFVDPALTLQKALALGLDTSSIGTVSDGLRTGVIPPACRVFTLDMMQMMPDAKGVFSNLVPGSMFDPATMLFGFSARGLAFLALLIAFAVKLPAVPLHTWLPDAHVQAPTAVSVLLASLLLKVGGYGVFRLCLGVFPDQFHSLNFWLAILGWVSLLFATLVAISQKDLKRLIAYSSIGHMGFVLLGASSATAAGINGGLMQMFNHGIGSAALFLIVGVLSDRTHDRTIANYSGLWSKLPQLSFVVLMTFFASMGFPGFNAFVSELLCFLGLFHAGLQGHLLPLWLVFSAVIGVLLNAILFLRTYRQMFFGKFSYAGDAGYELGDLNTREKLMLWPLCLLMLLLGFMPWLISQYSENGANDLSHLLGLFSQGAG